MCVFVCFFSLWLLYVSFLICTNCTNETAVNVQWQRQSQKSTNLYLMKYVFLFTTDRIVTAFNWMVWEWMAQNQPTATDCNIVMNFSFNYNIVCLCFYLAISLSFPALYATDWLFVEISLFSSASFCLYGFYHILIYILFEIKPSDLKAKCVLKKPSLKILCQKFDHLTLTLAQICAKTKHYRSNCALSQFLSSSLSCLFFSPVHFHQKRCYVIPIGHHTKSW